MGDVWHHRHDCQWPTPRNMRHCQLGSISGCQWCELQSSQKLWICGQAVACEGTRVDPKKNE